MIGWIFIAVAKSDGVLRGQPMTTIELTIHAVRSVAVTASHCRAREHQRKCDCTDQPEGHRNISSFQFSADEQRVIAFVHPIWECILPTPLNLMLEKTANPSSGRDRRADRMKSNANSESCPAVRLQGDGAASVSMLSIGSSSIPVAHSLDGSAVGR